MFCCLPLRLPCCISGAQAQPGSAENNGSHAGRKMRKADQKASAAERLRYGRGSSRLADGASVRLFYSRKRLTVTEPDVFAAALLKRMEKTGQLMPAPDGSGYVIRK